MTTHQSTVPRVAAAYFGCGTQPDLHPIIEAVYRPGRGWKRYPIRKRVSGSCILALRREGVTDVALRSGGRLADFRISELIPMTGLRG
jgi:hypothetical protein